jgi:hypothetical protein
MAARASARAVVNAQDRLVQVCTGGGLVPDILKRLGLPTPRQLDRGSLVAAPRLEGRGVSLAGRSIALVGLPQGGAPTPGLGQGLTALGATVTDAVPASGAPPVDGLVVHCGSSGFDPASLFSVVRGAPRF